MVSNAIIYKCWYCDKREHDGSEEHEYLKQEPHPPANQGNIISKRTVPALKAEQKWLTWAWAKIAALDREPKPEGLAQVQSRSRSLKAAFRTASRAGLDTCINAPGDCKEHAEWCGACFSQARTQGELLAIPL